MYFILESNFFRLEYITQSIIIKHKFSDSYIELKNESIINLMVISRNLFPGVIIEDLVIEGMSVHYNKEKTLTLNNTFNIEGKNLGDFITLINQTAAYVTGFRLNAKN